MGSVSTTSVFERASFIPPDAMFDLTRRYLADEHPDKVSVGPGAYRDEEGKPWVLPAVRMAKEKLGNNGTHEYLPIAGLKEFRDEAVELVFHGTKSLEEQRIASCQALSGTGSLMLAGLVLKQAETGIKKVYITDPTWSNHEMLFRRQGFEVGKLPYYKAADGSFDFDAYLAALRAADAGSAVVLHACAHNPTGCDPTQDEWRQIGAVLRERGLFPVVDAAYLGFNSGAVDADAWALRHLTEDLGLEAAVCLSFAKSMGLYGERVGLVAFVARSPAAARALGSVLESAQRATVSTPPAYGARIAAAVLGTPEIRAQWALDLVTMSTRIRAMRQRLFDELAALGTPGEWSHLVRQSGMFGYTGITKAQVSYLEEKHHVYMADSSRISVAGLNESNVAYFAKALDDAVRTIGGTSGGQK